MTESMRLIAATMLLGACSHVAPDNRIAVDISTGGDVGQTQRLVVDLMNRIGSSSDFEIASPPESGSIRINVPRNVRPIIVDGRNYVQYEAVFTRAKSDDFNLGSSIGRCPERRISDCASQILRDLIAVTRATTLKL